MCGGGAEKRARHRAKLARKRAERAARAAEKRAIQNAERQAAAMLEQQKAAYEAMEKMIPKPPPTPVNRPASTTVETAQNAPSGSALDGEIKVRKDIKKKKRGQSSLLIGLNPGVGGYGSGPNIR